MYLGGVVVWTPDVVSGSTMHFARSFERQVGWDDLFTWWSTSESFIQEGVPVFSSDFYQVGWFVFMIACGSLCFYPTTISSR